MSSDELSSPLVVSPVPLVSSLLEEEPDPSVDDEVVEEDVDVELLPEEELLPEDPEELPPPDVSSLLDDEPVDESDVSVLLDEVSSSSSPPLLTLPRSRFALISRTSASG